MLGRSFHRGAAVAAFVAALATCLPAPPARAGWLDRVLRQVDAVTPTSGRAARSLPPFEQAGAVLKALPAQSQRDALAVHLMPEGHWKLANAKGEVITAASPAELERALRVLVPDGLDKAGKLERRLTLYLSDEAAVAGGAARLRELPVGSQLQVVSEGRAFRLVRRGADKPAAEIRPAVQVEVGDLKAFRELVWQLGRPLSGAPVRIVSLELDGPRVIAARPRLEPGAKIAPPDAVDPFGLAKALPALRRQTVVVAGRLDGEYLFFRAKGGPEQSLMVKDLTRAAADADVSLVLLDARSGRQPGDRTWAFQKVTVSGLEQAVQGAEVADFLQALAAPSSGLVVRARAGEAGRMVLEAQSRAAAAQTASEPRSGFASIFREAVSHTTGTIATDLVRLELPDRERRAELDARLLPGLPSWLQLAYAALLLIGLAGLQVARGWWVRLWPREERPDYGTTVGWWAARAARGSLFLAVFMPLVAPASFPLQVVRGLMVTARLLWAIVSWPLTRRTA